MLEHWKLYHWEPDNNTLPDTSLISSTFKSSIYSLLELSKIKNVSEIINEIDITLEAIKWWDRLVFSYNNKILWLIDFHKNETDEKELNSTWMSNVNAKNDGTFYWEDVSIRWLGTFMLTKLFEYATENWYEQISLFALPSVLKFYPKVFTRLETQWLISGYEGYPDWEFYVYTNNFE